MSAISLWPIGVIHTPYRKIEDIPRQGRHSLEICEIEVYPEFAPGLKDIEQCSHLIIFYWLNLGNRTMLMAVPPHDHKEHGVFATRSPNRPNPIALDIVKLLSAKANTLTVQGMDALDGSMLLDIKPYSAKIDSIPEAKIGWQEDESRS